MAAFRHAMKSIIETVIPIIPIPTIWTQCVSTAIGASTSQPADTLSSATSAATHSAAINDGPRPVPKSAGVPIVPPTNALAEPAYDLDVDEAHCYFVQGQDGRAYLVSNSHCADALATLCLGLKDRKVERIANFYQTAFDPMVDRIGEYESEFDTEPQYDQPFLR